MDGVGTGDREGLTTTADRGEDGAAVIGLRMRGIGLDRSSGPIALGMAGTGDTGRRITGRRSRFTGLRQLGRERGLLRIIDRLEGLGLRRGLDRRIIVRRTMDGLRFSRCVRGILVLLGIGRERGLLMGLVRLLSLDLRIVRRHRLGLSRSLGRRYRSRLGLRGRSNNGHRRASRDRRAGGPRVGTSVVLDS